MAEITSRFNIEFASVILTSSVWRTGWRIRIRIAGSKVVLRVAASQLPEGFAHVGLFVPGAEHFGVGRISTGLGMPHVETVPDLLGLRASFVTPAGRQVDPSSLSIPSVAWR